MKKGANAMIIVLAPSGSGKSYAAEKFPNSFIDGDVIVASTVGWPPGKWWELPNALETKIKTWSALYKWTTQFKEDPRTVLFNVDPSVVDPSVVSGIWIPNEHIALRNLRYRWEKYNSSKNPQPTDLETFRRSARRYRSWSAEWGIPIYGGETPPRPPERASSLKD